jgi:glycosyltransferase involved in cell wall biosynthesis
MIILCFVDYYLPGYKYGGPIRSIANMVALLDDDFEFLIVTRDRDETDISPYPNVLIDQWNTVGQAKVFYASSATLSFLGVRRLLKETPHDVLYLNGFFSPLTTILPLIIRRLRLYWNKPVILAPRGSFSTGALALKETKKKIYIAFAKLTGIYSQLIWQASSEIEAEDIRCTFYSTPIGPDIIVACDLLSLPNQIIEEPASAKSDTRSPGSLRIIFLSRISPMKNLDYLLRVLNNVKATVALSIYGPNEDSVYWSHCLSLIQTLPSNISVSYHGEVTYEQVEQTFASYDVFVFPTRGENFGHVIYEALASGTAVIVSDQTLWQSDPSGALEVIPLERPDSWTLAINLRACFNEQAYVAQRASAVRYAANYLAKSPALEQNRSLFLSALGHSPLQADKSPLGLK